MAISLTIPHRASAIDLNFAKEYAHMNSAVFMYFVFPVLIGILIRSLFLKWKKAYLLSAGLVLISVVTWLWTSHLVNHGTDGTLLLLAVMAAELTAGSLITGGMALLIRKTKNRQTDNFL